MNSRHRVLGVLVGLSAVVALAAAPAGVAAATVTAPTAATATACTDGVWPFAVQGQPTLFKAGASAGDYLWHDASGWHVRVTHPGDSPVIFSGTIVASSPLDATPVKLEKNDTVTVGSDHRTITYRLVDYGAIDGFDFTTSCASHIVFAGRMDGVRLPPRRIWVGHADRHPLENPFVIRRIG